MLQWKMQQGSYLLVASNISQYGCLVQLVRTLVRKARDIGSSPKQPHLENHYARMIGSYRLVACNARQYGWIVSIG